MNKKWSYKKRMIQFSLLMLVMAGITGCNLSEKGKTDQERVEEMVSALSLEQKAQLLIGTGMFMDLPDSIKNMFGDRKMDENTDTLYTNMVDRIRKYLPGAAGFSSEFPEIGISSQVLADGPAGLRISPKRKGEERTYYCTAFPIATVLASSWDTELVYRVGEAMGNEVLEYGADVLLAPGMNIQRDPLCGRNFEYYSEDPLVTGKMAAAMVNGIQSNGVGTSVKHFAANNQETNRMSVNTVVSERALREIYLKGFEIAVKEAQPWTVMSSYNKINGVYTSESHDLLTKILRNDWGFAGYVMTDWGGGSDVVAQMEAGNDMIQPGQPKQIQELIAAVNEGRLDEAVLDQNLSRILGIMLKSPKHKGYAYSSNPDLQAHAAVTRQAATDGMVLLENKNQALPIAENLKKVAAFGNTSYDFVAGGTGSGDVNEAYTISLIEGLKNGGFETDEELAAIYEAYIQENRAKSGNPKNWLAALMGGKEPVEEMPLAKALAAKMAGKADVALITIGRNSGEGGDREAVEGDFYLTATEKAMIKDVTEAFRAKGKKAIVVLNVGGVIETASWREWPDAVLMAWQPGQEAGNSVVDVLTGKVNPSGKLAVTFPLSYQDAPSAKNFPGVEVKSDQTDDAADLSGFSFMRRVPWEVVYEEDIYVGYRYYNTFNVPVAYEFGYGLSYTNFEYANLQLGSATFDGTLTASIEVKNTGSVAGREVVQLYAGAPNGKLEKPEATLVAFGKTRLLQPGESETLSFTINASDLASFDEAASAWIIEPGSYSLKVGASSLKIHQTASFEVDSEMNVGQVSKALAPQRSFDRLSLN
ncbi:glycoside hydrolase family 3 C-terminal domain-containing protein [Gaoshiqia sediminis]|uniref:Glycoside hydrolase family 3 C-terminal domain-containing protein n=1 Tax=Gaoshiqia sediminis TaxID=2986998 RepID=A0AA41Y9S4_9BACT|nr:glycoside hydrolase family 3 C-terminal domain-containing protein [Gaoshiqia sediminis]MCW0482078.1 glycoside hydrolase family 3 C-terminal domain-containing protein [Gaoshiqia sediminis]